MKISEITNTNIRKPLSSSITGEVEMFPVHIAKPCTSPIITETDSTTRNEKETGGISATIPDKNTITASKGIAGDDGLSAYQIALKNGFVGTESEWIKSLKGDKGDKGDSPIRGVDYFTEEDRTAIIDEVLENFPLYDGEYRFIPKAHSEQIVECDGMVMKDNITVAKVPYFETSNDSGDTVYIASEL